MTDKITSTERTVRPDKPPFESWFVVEVDVERDRENPLYASIRGPFATREQAEHERDEQKKAWQRAISDWDGEHPYEFKGWDIVEKHISDYQLGQLDREDEESYQRKKDAASAVGASLLAGGDNAE